MSPQAPNRPLVVRGADVQTESVRSNPALTKKSLFSNFAGGYLVGASIAYHPEGEECGTHNHSGAVELFVVVSGTGIIEVDGEHHQVAADDAVLVPVGSRHNLIGTSKDTPFKVVCIFVAAPGHEDNTRPWLPTE